MATKSPQQNQLQDTNTFQKVGIAEDNKVKNEKLSDVLTMKNILGIILQMINDLSSNPLHALYIMLIFQFFFFTSFIVTYVYLISRENIKTHEIEGLKDSLWNQVRTALDLYQDA